MELSFNQEINRAIMRLAATKAEVRPTNPEDGNAMARLERQLSFLEKHKHLNGFSPYHVAMFPTCENLCQSIVKGCTQSQARGHGRIASVLDRSRSIGSGFRSGIKSIMDFLEIPEGMLSFDVDKRTQLTFPQSDMVLPSVELFRRLDSKLRERRDMIATLKISRRRPSKGIADTLLIKNNWDEYNIKSAVIELAARWFANSMDSQKREQLVLDSTMPITDALDSIKLLQPA